MTNKVIDLKNHIINESTADSRANINDVFCNVDINNPTKKFGQMTLFCKADWVVGERGYELNPSYTNYQGINCKLTKEQQTFIEQRMLAAIETYMTETGRAVKFPKEHKQAPMSSEDIALMNRLRAASNRILMSGNITKNDIDHAFDLINMK